MIVERRKDVCEYIVCWNRRSFVLCVAGDALIVADVVGQPDVAIDLPATSFP